MHIQFLLKSLTIGFVVSTASIISLPALAQSTTGSTNPANQQVAQTPGTIVDVAAGNDDFDTLVQAVQAAGLASTLAGPGPFTVFAPTDAAFAALPSGALQALVQPQNRDLLTDILTYHVVPGRVTSDDLETGTVNSLNGPLNVNVAPNNVTVNNVRVITPDVEASNGVIHAIDRVLIPQDTAAELTRRLTAQTRPAPTTRPAPVQPAPVQPAPAETAEEPAPAAAPVRALW